MSLDSNHIATFGDVRRSILDTINQLKSGDMAVDRGMAIAAAFKVLNDNVQVEVNAAKMALLTEGRAHNFGRIVGMGQRVIGNDSSQQA
jgi:rRNA processing protein Krr1/Pno1